MLVVYSWLKDYLGKAMPPADELDKLLTYHAFEVEDVKEEEKEIVFDLDVLPNRSSDSLSHRGVARELATILDVDLEHDPLATAPDLPTVDKVKIEIADKEACARFSVSLITGIEVKESPKWLQTRLKVLGQRPINNIVDATNYVMYALGQPMHAYDADKFASIDGTWHFGVRFAKEGETIDLLSEGGKEEDRTIELKGTELLITEKTTDTPVGLAGVKGGRFAELTADTKNILVEAANFDSVVIRKTARRLGILTDASRRFENAPVSELAAYAQREISELIAKIAGGELVGLADEYLAKKEPVITKVRTEKVNSLLGLNLSTEEISEYITRTGAQVEKEEGGVLLVTAPWERTDLNIEADYIEEVGRIHGLSNITPVELEPIPLVEVNPRQYYSEKIRQVLIAVGYSEVITSSFLKKGKIQLQNALASDKSYIRHTLKKNITVVLDKNYPNIDLLGLPDVRVFEIGTVFNKGGELGVMEHISLALGARTKGSGYSSQDDKVLAAGVEAVEEVLGIELKWGIEKGVAELNLSEAIEQLPKPEKYDPVLPHSEVKFKTISQYPAVARDIALWVGEETTPEMILTAIKEVAGGLLVRETLFDVFEKDGRTSYAFRLVFQSANRTLTDSEVNSIMENIYEIAKTNKWEVR